MHEPSPRVFSRQLSLAAALCAVILVGALLNWYRGYRPAPIAAAAPSQKPDVVYILTDDQFYRTLWAMPKLRAQLVQKGVRFTNVFASNPLCAPSRASILTGQYSHTTGLYDNRSSSYGSADTFHESGYERQTMATWFHAAGYRTAIVGKYVNGFACRWVPPNWDVSDIGPGYFGPTLCENGTEHQYPSTTYSTALFGSQAVDFIDGTPQSTPLFLYLTPYAPHANAPPEPRYKHLPVDPFRFWPRPNFNEANVSDKPSFIRRIPTLSAPGRWQVNWLRRRQYRTLRSVDDMIGRVTAALARRGTLGNTIIVFMSDNGQMWGSHRMTAATKRVAYDESLRLPLVVRWDGRVPADVVARQLVGNIDVAPTLAALAGVPVPTRTDGVSFAPIIKRPSGPPVRTSLLLEQAASRSTPSDRVYTPNYCGLRTPGYTFVHYAGGAEELYNDVRDPYQLSNLAGSPAWQGPLGNLRTMTESLCTPTPPDFGWG